MNQYRKSKRVSCYAKVIIENCPGYIRDVTSEGIKVTTVTPLVLERGEEYEMGILPDDIHGIIGAQFKIILKWEKSEGLYHVYGFELTGFEDDKSEENYNKLIAYYKV